MEFSDLQCCEFLLCFGQWLGEVVFAPEQFSHPHAAFLCRKVASMEHTFIGGHLIRIITKYTILALENAPLVQKGLYSLGSECSMTKFLSGLSQGSGSLYNANGHSLGSKLYQSGVKSSVLFWAPSHSPVFYRLLGYHSPSSSVPLPDLFFPVRSGSDLLSLQF